MIEHCRLSKKELVDRLLKIEKIRIELDMARAVVSGIKRK
jgi:hypothetical protein